MHSEIIKHWEKHGKITDYGIWDSRHKRWSLCRPGRVPIIIAYIYDGVIMYYKNLNDEEVLTEKEMLSYISLQAFL